MNSTRSFEERSYQQHAAHYREYAQDGEKATHARTWFEEDTADAWRHQRMYKLLDPILATEPQAKWLTVGDGRYGRDAKYILDRGSAAVATDISEHLLKEAKESGYLPEYKVENAESLSFCDSEFDYVFCKESYHHFPRPMVALYEMLRVVSRGVVLLEPNDLYITNSYSQILFRNLKNIVRFFLGKETSRHRFEETGNYVFSISRREVEKVALGLNYRTLAFRGINDVFFPGVEGEKISDNGPLQKKTKRLISTADFLCRLGLMDYGNLAAVVFKTEPSRELLQQLGGSDYEIVRLPDNPHISD